MNRLDNHLRAQRSLFTNASCMVSFILISSSFMAYAMKLDDDQLRETWEISALAKKGPYAHALKLIRDNNFTELKNIIENEPLIVRKHINRSGFEVEVKIGKVQAPILLHYAAHQGHVKCIALLLKHSSPVNVLNIYGSIIRTPLDCAKRKAAQKLLKKHGGKTFKKLMGVM